MKLITRFAAVILATGMIAPAATMLAQGPPPPGYGDRGPGGPGGWDAPPSNFSRDIQRQGFHDGIEGARKDFGNHRRPNVNNRDEYRNYRGPERRNYREAFAQGYRVGVQHLMGGGGPRPY
jgi:hypothetical protein